MARILTIQKIIEMKKKTVVIGASANPERYSYEAVARLNRKGHPVVAVGLKKGMIGSTPVHDDRPAEKDVDTVSLYVGAKNQPVYYDYILNLNPKRIIFNPGAENPELKSLAADKGIEVLEACTLVMLSIGNY